MNANIQVVCNELVSALLAGGTQGLLIVGLVWAALKVFRPLNAATRHAVWFATLLIVGTLPVAIFLQPYSNRVQEAAKDWLHEWNRGLAPIAPAAVEHFEIPAFASIEESVVGDTEAEAATAAMAETSVEPEMAEQPTSFGNWELTIPSYIGAAFVGFCALLAMIRLGALAGQLYVLYMIKRRALPAPTEPQAIYLTVHKRMGLVRHPRLLVSDEISAPMAAGFFRPAVLVPEALVGCATASQLEAVFRHELAHIARRDDWANLLQQAVAAIFFFHPGIQFVSRRLSAEREIACDDHALAGLRAPRDYALFLTEFASRMTGRDFSAAPAAWSSNSQLKERIGMILDHHRNASPRVSRAGASAIAAATIAAALAVMISAPRLVLAGEASAGGSSSATVTSASGSKTIVATSEASPEGIVTTTVESSDGEEPVVIKRVSRSPARVAVAGLPPVAPVPALAPTTVVTVTPAIPGAPVAVMAMPPGQPGPHAFAIAQGGPDAAPAPHPRPHAKRVERDGDDDIERRLDRLEKMVESLAKNRERGEVRVERRNFDQLSPDIQAQVKVEIEKARKDAEHARKDAEKAAREFQSQDVKKHFDEANRAFKFQFDQNMNWNQGGGSLEARRKALEASRRELEKQIAALDKEMAQAEKEHAQVDKEHAQEHAEREKERAERDKEREKARQERDKARQERDKARQEKERAEQKEKSDGDKHRDTGGDNKDSSDKSNKQ